MLRLFSRGITDEALSSVRKGELKALCKKLGIKVKALSLLDRALTHSSFQYNGKKTGSNYERLEFLGDSILNASVSEILFWKRPQDSEGKLSSFRSSVVDEKTLAEIGEKIGVLDYIRFGNGETVSDRRAKQKITADVMESIIAVLFLERGFRYASRFVLRVLTPSIDLRLRKGTRDYKTRLQQYCVDCYREYPVYTVQSEHGPDHNKIFVIRVSIPDGFYAVAEGRSKKEAEQMAAELILKKISEDKRPKQ